MSGTLWSGRRMSCGSAVIVLFALMLAGCSAPPASAPAPEKPVVWPAVPGYEPMKIPPENAMTTAKVELGKQLYYDTRMSGDGKRSCYSCHVPEHGLTDGKPVAIGAFEKPLTRSSPTMWNIGYHSEWYWDGRAKTLEGQAKAAWAGGNMGASGKEGAQSQDQICATLNSLADYGKQFKAVFGAGCTPDNASQALAAFMRTIVSTDSPWIRFRGGDKTALSEAAQRGYQVFDVKAQCSKCHSGILLTDQQFHNVGVGMAAKEPDLGRYNVTKNDRDRGAFKTPTLLDVSKSAPYFHNGSVATLEQAVDQMLGGGIANPSLDRENLKPVKLNKQERQDLLQFLRELTANYAITAPKLPQ